MSNDYVTNSWSKRKLSYEREELATMAELEREAEALRQLPERTPRERTRLLAIECRIEAIQMRVAQMWKKGYEPGITILKQ